RWLHDLGVAYVVLTDAAPDYSAVQEAALLRGGRSSLTLAHRAAHTEIFRVPAAQPIVSGPDGPRLTALDRDGMTVHIAAPGSYGLAVRSSPSWTADRGCLLEGADGMLRWQAPAAGTYRIAFRVSVPALLDAIAPQAGRGVCA